MLWISAAQQSDPVMHIDILFQKWEILMEWFVLSHYAYSQIPEKECIYMYVCVYICVCMIGSLCCMCIYIYVCVCVCVCVCVYPHLWHAEVPRPGIKPKPQQGQHQILNHYATRELPKFKFFFFFLATAWFGISVTRPGIKPRLQWWKHWILTTGLSGNSIGLKS